MIYYAGPESYKAKLKDIYESLSDRFNSISQLIGERADKLDNAFGHFMTLVVQASEKNFPVISAFVDSEGRGFVGLSNSSPFETASALYRFEKDEDLELKEIFKVFFADVTNFSFKRAIFQTPLKLYFLAYYGNARLLRREILKDSLRGKEYFSFPEIVDDELVNICMLNYRKWLTLPRGEIFLFPVQNILKICFGLPRSEVNLDRSVIIELSRFFRAEIVKKHGSLKSSSVTPDMKIDRPVAMVFQIDLTDSREVMLELPKLYDFYCDFIDDTFKEMTRFIEIKYPFKKGV